MIRLILALVGLFLALCIDCGADASLDGDASGLSISRSGSGSGFEVSSIDGVPVVMLDILASGVGERVFGAEFIDAENAGWIKKTIAVPVNVLAKVLSAPVEVGKTATSYAGQGGWEKIKLVSLLTILADLASDGDSDIYNSVEDLFDSDSGKRERSSKSSDEGSKFSQRGKGNRIEIEHSDSCSHQSVDQRGENNTFKCTEKHDEDDE